MPDANFFRQHRPFGSFLYTLFIMSDHPENCEEQKIAIHIIWFSVSIKFDLNLVRTIYVIFECKAYGFNRLIDYLKVAERSA